MKRISAKLRRRLGRLFKRVVTFSVCVTMATMAPAQQYFVHQGPQQGHHGPQQGYPWMQPSPQQGYYWPPPVYAPQVADPGLIGNHPYAAQGYGPAMVPGMVPTPYAAASAAFVQPAPFPVAPIAPSAPAPSAKDDGGKVESVLPAQWYSTSHDVYAHQNHLGDFNEGPGYGPVETTASFSDIDRNFYFWLRHIEGQQIGDTTAYSSAGGSVYYPLVDGIVMFDGQVILSNEAQVAGNLGIIGRTYLAHGIAGASLWYDLGESRADNFYQQFGLSLEYLTCTWNLRGNVYSTIGTDSRIIDTTQIGNPGNSDPAFFGNNLIKGGRLLQTHEFAMDGLDLEISRHLDFLKLPTFEAFGGYYHLDGGGLEADGVKGGLRGYIFRSLSGEVTVSHDDTFGTNVFGGLTLFFGGQGGDSPCDPCGCNDKLTIPVIRNERIAIREERRVIEDDLEFLTKANERIRIVHVDSSDSNGPGPEGSFTNPLASLNEIQPNSQEGDIILVHGGSVYNDQQAVLQDNQQILGEGLVMIDGTAVSPGIKILTDQMGFIPLPATAMGADMGPAPMINVTNPAFSGNVITLGTMGNAVAGLQFRGGGSSGTAIGDSSAGATDTLVGGVNIAEFSAAGGYGVNVTPSTNTKIVLFDFANNDTNVLLNATGSEIHTGFIDGGNVGIQLDNATGTNSIGDPTMPAMVVGAAGMVQLMPAGGFDGTVDIDNVDQDGLLFNDAGPAANTVVSNVTVDGGNGNGLRIVGGSLTSLFNINNLDIGATNPVGGFGASIEDSDSTVEINLASTIINPRDTAFNVDGGAGMFNFRGNLVQNSAARAVVVDGLETGGSVLFAPGAGVSITADGLSTGILVQNTEPGSTVTFGDTNIGQTSRLVNDAVTLLDNMGTTTFQDVRIATNGGRGIVGNNAGIVEIGTVTPQAVDTIGRAALDIDTATVGAADWTFTTLSSVNSDAEGIDLDNISALNPGVDRLTVNTDVNVSNAALDGVSIDTSDVIITLQDVDITKTGEHGMELIELENFNLGPPTSTIVDAGIDGIFGQDSNLSIDNVKITNPVDDGIQYVNTGNNRTVNLMNITVDPPSGQGLDVDVQGPGDLTLSVVDSSFDAMLDGVDVDLTGSGDLMMSMQRVTASSEQAAGFDIDGSAGAGTLWMTRMDDLVVLGTPGGNGGVLLDTITFDATPGGAIQQVSGNTINIGTTGNRVQGDGLRFDAPTGNLAFSNPVNIFNNGGTGLFVDTKTQGTIFNLASGGGTVDTTNGAAMFLDPLTGDLTLDMISSTNAPVTGNNLGAIHIEEMGNDPNTGGPALTVTGAVNISMPGERGIAILDSDGDFDFNGPVTISNSGDNSIDVDGLGGTVDFTAAVDIDNAGANGVRVANTTLTTAEVKFTGPLNIDTTVDHGLLLESVANFNMGPPDKVITNAGIDGIHVIDSNASIDNVKITNPVDDGIQVVNTDTNRTVNLLNITVDPPNGQGLDVDVEGPGDLTLTVTDSSFDAMLDGVDVDLTGSGDLMMRMERVTASSEMAAGFDIDGSVGSGTIWMTRMDDLVVLGTSGGNGGVLLDTVTFDATPGGAIQQASGNSITIGSMADRVQGDGLRFDAPTGNLAFSTVNIYNNGGTGLYVDTKTEGTTFNLVNASGTIDTTNGAAMFLDPLTGDLDFTTISSTNAPVTGNNLGAIHIDQMDNDPTSGGPALTVTGAVNISMPGERGIAILDSDGDFDFNGPVTISDSGDNSIDVDGLGGTVDFTAAVDIDNAGANGVRVANTTLTTAEVKFTGPLNIDTTVDHGLLVESVANFNMGPPGKVITNAGIDGIHVIDSNASIDNVKITNPVDDGIQVVNTDTNRTVNLLNITVDPPNGQGLDVDVTGSGDLTLSVSDSTFDAMLDGMDVDLAAGSTGDLTLALMNRTEFSSEQAAGIDINGRNGGGTIFITQLNEVIVRGTPGGDGGMLVDTANFDMIPGGGNNRLISPSIAIGDPLPAGPRVQGDGLRLTAVSGDLFVTDLDIRNNGGTGLSIDTKTDGTNFIFGTGVGSTIDTTNGMAAFIDPVDGDMIFDSISSTNSPTRGIYIDTLGLDGTDMNMNMLAFTVTGATTISDSTLESILIENTTGDVTFAGLVDIDRAGTDAVAIADTTAAVSFNGGLDIDVTGQHGVELNNVQSFTLMGTGADVPSSNVNISDAGVNGIDITDSNATIEFVKIDDPVLDGIEITNLDTPRTVVIDQVNIDPPGAQGIDVNVTGSGNLDLTVDDVEVTAMLDGLDVDLAGGSTGDLTLALMGRTEFSSEQAAGIDINGRDGGGTIFITDLNEVIVRSTPGGNGGMLVDTATFDMVPGDGNNRLISPSIAIGDPLPAGPRVQGDGLRLTAVSGDLFVTDLDIRNNGGTGLSIDTKTDGTNFIFGTGVGSTIDTTNGMAAFIDPVDGDMIFDTISSTNSPTRGIYIDTLGLDGTDMNTNMLAFTVTGATTISDSTLESILIENTTGDVTFAGLVDIDRAGTDAVAIADTTATVTFSGGLDVDITGEHGVELDNVEMFTLMGSGGAPVSSNVNITGAGMDGINVTDSNATIDFVKIDDPAADGIEITNLDTDRMVSIVNTNVDPPGEQGIDINLAGRGDLALTVMDSEVEARLDAIDADSQAGSTGDLSLALSGMVTVSSEQAAGIDINGSLGGGTVFVTDLNQVIVRGTLGGNGGILVNTATFDADPGATGVQQVTGDVAVGDPLPAGPRVQGDGFRLDAPTGDLALTASEINVRNNNGTGIYIDTKTAGTDFNFTTGAGSSVDTTNGQAMFIDPVNGLMQFTSISSTDSPTDGVFIDTVSNLGAGPALVVSGATTIERAADRGLVIQNSTGDFTFSGPVTVNTTTSGDAVLLDGNSGDVSFDGIVDIDDAGEDGIHINGLDPAGSVDFSMPLTIDETDANGLHVSNTEGTITFSDVAINDAGTDGVLLDNVDQFTLTGNGQTVANTVDIRRSGDDAVEIVDSNADITGIKINDPSDEGIIVRMTGSTSRVVNLTSNVVDPPGGNGIEIALESGSSGSLVANLAGNDVESVGDALNVHTDAGSSGNLELALSEDGDGMKNLFGSTSGAGIIVDGSAGGGQLFVTELRANVEGNTTTDGAVFTDVVFDANPAGGGVTPVTGDMAIGTAGSRVNGRGLALNGPSGALSFTDLDIFNDGGTGLYIDTKTVGTSLDFTTGAGSSVDTINGQAMFIDPVNGLMQFASISSMDSPTDGVFIDTVSNLGAGPALVVSGATTIERAADRGLVIQNSTGDFTFSGPVTVNTTTSGDAVLLDGNSGAVSFDGAVDIDDAGEDGVHINDLDPAGSVSFGSSLTVDETDANGLHVSNSDGSITFTDVAINDAGTDGILLDNVDQFTLTGNGMAANTVDIRRSGDDAVEIVDSNADITGIKITDPTDGGIVTRITGAASRVVNLTGNIVDPPGGAGIEIALESGSSGSLVANLAGNDVESVGDALNVHTDSSSSGDLELALSEDSGVKNEFDSASGAGINVDGSAGSGELFVTDLRANVEGNTTTNGAIFDTVVFNSTPGGGVSDVAGDMVIGGPADRVQERGLYLIDPTGSLDFDDLRIWNDGNTGLEVDGQGAATFALRVQDGFGGPSALVNTTNSTAIDVVDITADLVFADIESRATGGGMISGDGVVVARVVSAGGGAADNILDMRDFDIDSTNDNGLDFKDSTGTFNVANGEIDGTMVHAIEISGSVFGDLIVDVDNIDVGLVVPTGDGVILDNATLTWDDSAIDMANGGDEFDFNNFDVSGGTIVTNMIIDGTLNCNTSGTNFGGTSIMTDAGTCP